MWYSAGLTHSQLGVQSLKLYIVPQAKNPEYKTEIKKARPHFGVTKNKTNKKTN